jgi:hypothetical protein
MRRLTILAVLLLVFLPALSAQVVMPQRPGMPPRDARQAQPPSGTASISGRITAADSGMPLRRVQVRATSAELRGSRTTLTDADGRFTLAELPAGRYTLSLSKPGFAQMQYGQKRPQQPGTPIDVADGQKVADANVAMPRGGVIAGFVYDEFGEPVVDARVMALQYRWTGGRRRLIPATRPGISNDRGEFRIWGLAPGEYYVSATGSDQMRFSEPGAQTSGDDSGYATTYYPGTPALEMAQRVSVQTGQETGGIAFSLLMTRTARLSGTALTSEGKPMSGGMVMLTSRGAGAGMMMSAGGAMVDAKGAFTVSNVVPGEYTVVARGARTPGVTGPDVPQDTAEANVVVAGEDITGLVLTATRGVTVSGRVMFEGTPPAEGLEQLRVALAPTDEVMTFGPNAGPVRADGEFEIGGVSGRRRATVFGLPAGWALKAFRIGGVDVADADYDFERDVAGAEVVLTSNLTVLTGTARDDRNEPVSDYAVLVFSTDEDQWLSRSRRVNTGRSDQNGAYRIRGLPPGSYYVMAVESVPDDWGNPELFDRLKPFAREVTLSEGQTEAVDLMLTVVPE